MNNKLTARPDKETGFVGVRINKINVVLPSLLQPDLNGALFARRDDEQKSGSGGRK